MTNNKQLFRTSKKQIIKLKKISENMQLSGIDEQFIVQIVRLVEYYE